MPLTTTSRRMRRGLRNHPAPLDLTLLGAPGPSNHRRRAILVSAARPSVKESVAVLGLNYALSSGGIPDLSVAPSVPSLPRPLPQIPNPAFPRSSPDLVLDISTDSSHYTTTDAPTTLLGATSLTTPPNLKRLYTLSLPPSPHYKESADAAIRPPPLPPPSDPISPSTPPLLTPAPVRPARRWGMMVFPQDKVIRRVSSAPSSPISFDNTVVSPTSIVAMKSPVEHRDSKRLSTVSLISPFTVSFTQEIDVPPIPTIPAEIPPVPSIKPPIPAAAPTPEDSVPDIDVELSRSVSKISKIILGKKSSLDIIRVSSSPANDEEKPRSPKVKADPKSLLRGSNSHYKRIPSMHRPVSSGRRPNRRLMLKRDSGAPFAHHVAMATEVSSTPTEAEIKEGPRNTERWSASRRIFQASNKGAKATVVMMGKGKEKAEEKDIVTIIPQLRELKTSKRLRS